ncbi:UDP-galactopyranose mutase [uncultured Clostridium sp.]|uniref:UDP-galactopyranose mutase n=1 Tax=uncultured Clostridium sp. TaxID=59620 RepID=UPI0025D4B8A3|nr:UDP-galactopyranose mutase [uncultured Clostridium sp.]
MYDYLIVGAGLFGSVFAYEATKKGKTCLVVDKRKHIGGNVYTENIKGINVHKYGAHIFHTSNKMIWDYIQQFATFNRYTNSPIAIYKDEVYNLPFNMNTFSKLWGIKTPQEAKEIIENQRKKSGIINPSNLEEQAISLVGKDIYEKLIKGYTQKQWGKSCDKLPSFIINRLPVRFTYDDNYFNDLYQGIPVGGYTQIFEKMLASSDVRLNCDYLKHRDELNAIAKKIIYTGMIDEYFDYCYGELEYRSLRFVTEILNMDNFQGNAVVNYTDADVPYTRIIEHKHFEYGTQDSTIITKEYPKTWKRGDEPFYPINNEKNNILYSKYLTLAKQEKNVVFGGRLGMYRYFDMHNIIERSLECARNELD